MESGGHPITGSIRCSINSTRCFKLALRVQNEAALQHNFIDKRRPIRMQTSKNFLPTSIPAHRSTLTSSMTLSLRREANAFLSVLPLGLCWAPIGGSFASARPLYLTGFSPKTRTAFSLRPPTLSPSNPSRQGSFSSSEVARRAMNVYLARHIGSLIDSGFLEHLQPLLSLFGMVNALPGVRMPCARDYISFQATP